MDERSTAHESAPFLAQHNEENHPSPMSDEVPAPIVRSLYLSHFLSTWNSRVFEFGAVLYLATVYPGTLSPMSVYALLRGVSAIVFAPLLGQYIDRGDRLQVVSLSIVLQRIVVAASCAIFYVLALHLPQGHHGGNIGMFSILVGFACIEKLSSIMNSVSVEKDWVVAVAEKTPETLTAMNAQMRRIDLFCKLLGPLFVALIDGISTEVAICVNLVMNVLSIPLEYFAIARVYYSMRVLQQPRTAQVPGQPGFDAPQESNTQWKHYKMWLQPLLTKYASDFSLYFHHRAFFPSIAGALLYMTVLSFAGQMVTYLLTVGYSSTQVGVARIFSVAFELLATWIAPWMMGRVGPIRAGLWLSSWQLSALIAGVGIFWTLPSTPSISASGLVVGTIISRVGLRGFDLCVQIIVQEEVETEIRGAFSTVEAAWQNAFELLSFATTIVFDHPELFKWPSLMSVVAVAVASFTYTGFVYSRRGHLLHLDALKKLLSGRDERKREMQRGIERITSSSEI